MELTTMTTIFKTPAEYRAAARSFVAAVNIIAKKARQLGDDVTETFHVFALNCIASINACPSDTLPALYADMLQGFDETAINTSILALNGELADMSKRKSEFLQIIKGAKAARDSGNRVKTTAAARKAYTEKVAKPRAKTGKSKAEKAIKSAPALQALAESMQVTVEEVKNLPKAALKKSMAAHIVATEESARWEKLAKSTLENLRELAKSNRQGTIETLETFLKSLKAEKAKKRA